MSLAANAGLATDDRGRILTDTALRSVSHPEVYAVLARPAIRPEPSPPHSNRIHWLD
jgi:hypothetical protein